MGRLDCKDASQLAFESLRRDADTFVTVSDPEAAAAVARLADAGIATTPSGAAGYAALRALEPGAGASCMIIASEGPEGA
jgi:diaminopropionate ammonia-lyase